MFVVGARHEERHDFFYDPHEIEIGAIKHELADLELRIDQNVVDERQERFRRGSDELDLAALLEGKRPIEHEPGHAENAIQGRAHLVAHYGKKIRLGAQGDGGLLFRAFAIGDVAHREDGTSDAPLLVVSGRPSSADPGDRAVRSYGAMFDVVAHALFEKTAQRFTDECAIVRMDA